MLFRSQATSTDSEPYRLSQLQLRAAFWTFLGSIRRVLPHPERGKNASIHPIRRHYGLHIRQSEAELGLEQHIGYEKFRLFLFFR